jgi:hypothetical protein
MEMIKRDLNVQRIIRTLHDVERFKEIFLNEKQKKIFTRAPNPLVIIDSHMYNEENQKSALFKSSGRTKIIPSYFIDMFEGMEKNL